MERTSLIRDLLSRSTYWLEDLKLEEMLLDRLLSFKLSCTLEMKELERTYSAVLPVQEINKTSETASPDVTMGHQRYVL